MGHRPIFDQPDGTPVLFNNDYFNEARVENRNQVGPFSNLQTENKGLVQQIEKIQTDIVSKYHDDNKEMIRVIERNTETINNILEK